MVIFLKLTLGMCARPGDCHLKPPLPSTMPTDLLGISPTGDVGRRTRTKKPEEEPGSQSGWDSIHTQFQRSLDKQSGKEAEVVNVISV